MQREDVALEAGGALGGRLIRVSASRELLEVGLVAHRNLGVLHIC